MMIFVMTLEGHLAWKTGYGTTVYKFTKFTFRKTHLTQENQAGKTKQVV